jgi:hypothetical protein
MGVEGHGDLIIADSTVTRDARTWVLMALKRF